MNKTKRNLIQSAQGIDDLNIIMNELNKSSPNSAKLKQLTKKYGISCKNDDDPKVVISDLICFLDHLTFDKV